MRSRKETGDRHGRASGRSVSEQIRAYRIECRRRLVDLLIRTTLFMLAVAMLFTMVFGVTLIHGSDMYPALRDGDVVLYYRLGDRIRSDVVIYEQDGEEYAGRIEGLPGSEISATEDLRITVDGRFQPVQPSQGIFAETRVDRESASALPVRLEEGGYYILGDRRDDARDSRQFGVISQDAIKGKVFTVWRRRSI